MHHLRDEHQDADVAVAVAVRELVLVAQMVHLVIMGDFFYFYLRSVKKGLPIQLPSPSSANMV